MILEITLIRRKGGRGKWHIYHQWALCYAANVYGFGNDERRFDLLVEESLMHDDVVLSRPNSGEVIDAYDVVCRGCWNNLRIRLKKAIGHT